MGSIQLKRCFALIIKLIPKLMDQIAEEKSIKLLAKPLRHSTNSIEKNIFASLHKTERLPSLHKIRGKSYDLVGSQQFRDRLLQPQQKPSHEIENTGANQSLNMTGLPSNFNTTLNRQTIMSKMTHQQRTTLVKESKQMDRYREYKNFWDAESQKIRKKTMRKPNEQTLLENNVKGIYVQPNQDRMDIINTFVVNYWEMSLRNNNKILQRHIKGNKYGKVELQEMLQTDRGLKAVEHSIPVLPLDKLRQTKGKQLSVSGRNRALTDTQRTYGTRRSIGDLTNRTQNQQQVYKIQYTGNVKWMSMEGL